VLVGGRLSTQLLIDAYQRGIFPWPITDERGRPLNAWFSPNPRAIIELDQFHTPARLARRIRRGEFSFTLDKAFSEVIDACAERPKYTGTWITEELRTEYLRLHELNVAHSLEVWQDQQLVGGIYGVAMGGYFSAESKFHHRTDASKAALHYLAQHLLERGFALLDVQIWSPHLAQFGAINIPRSEFLRRQAKALKLPVTFD